MTHRRDLNRAARRATPLPPEPVEEFRPSVKKLFRQLRAERKAQREREAHLASVKLLGSIHAAQDANSEAEPEDGQEAGTE